MSRPGDQYKCTCPQPRLMVLIGGTAVPVHATFTGDPLSGVYTARCAICRGRYVGPWQLTAPGSRPVRAAGIPQRIARLLGGSYDGFGV